MVRLCQEFHCLPGPGPLFDQDPVNLFLIETVLAADTELRKKEQEQARREAKRK